MTARSLPQVRGRFASFQLHRKSQAHSGSADQLGLQETLIEPGFADDYSRAEWGAHGGEVTDREH